MSDTRTLAQLASEALAVQDACNLSGVVHGFSRAVTRLRELLPRAGTAEINKHPICILWSSKVADLCHSDCMLTLSYAIEECEKLKLEGERNALCKQRDGNDDAGVQGQAPGG